MLCQDTTTGFNVGVKSKNSCLRHSGLLKSLSQTPQQIALGLNCSGSSEGQAATDLGIPGSADQENQVGPACSRTFELHNFSYQSVPIN